MARLFGIAGCLFALAWVALSALSAHAFTDLAEASRARIATALTMLIPHALALLLLAQPTSTKRAPVLNLVGLAMLLGSVLFCGSLLALAFGAPRMVAQVAPFGGGLLMLGWLLWAISFVVRGAKKRI